MTRAARVVGAALGLVVLAIPLGIGPLRAAQTNETFTAPAECSEPPPAPQQNGITVSGVSPTGTEARTTPTVAVGATYANESRRPIVNSYNGEITEMRVVVLACEPGQIPPPAPDPVRPVGEPRTATFSWTAEFTTNGRFAIVLEAQGSNTSGDVQTARVVAPVQLAVPPKKPTNVSVTDPTNGVVTVSWDYVDPEPDLFGFEIRRAKQGTAEYTTIRNGAVGPKVRSVSDTPPVGAWRYQVVAYRSGAPEGAVSRDDTVEVAEPAPTATSDGGGTTSGGTGASSSSTGSGTAGSGSGSDSGSATTAVGSGSPGSPNTPRASVDLSQFAAALNARRTPATVRVEPPDPGFDETLPFDTSRAREAEEAEEPEELGADEPNVGLGQRVAADPGERRRSLGFVAFGLLLFVLSMTGLFLKGEVKRADLFDLDALDDPDEVDDLDLTSADVDADAVAVPAAVAALPDRTRRRRAVAEGPATEAISPATSRRGRRGPDPVAATGDRAPRDAELATEAVPEVVAAAPAPAGRRATRVAEDVPAPASALPTRAIRRRAAAEAATPVEAPDVTPVLPDDEPAAPRGRLLGLAAPTSGRRGRRTAEPAPSNGALHAGTSIAHPEARRARPWSARTAAEPAPSNGALHDGTSIAYPEARRRARPWSTRPAEPATPAIDDYADLGDDEPVPAAAAAAPTPGPTPPRRARRTEPPLDAPGLDVPDPPRRPRTTTTTTTATRARTTKAKPKPPLPARKPASSRAATKATKATAGRR